MGRTYVRDGFKIVQVEHPTEKDGRAYHVVHDELGYIGLVGTYQARFERRPFAGARYVTRRWYSERWWAYLESEPSTWKSRPFDGPGQAAQSLVWRAESEAKWGAQAKAKREGVEA